MAQIRIAHVITDLDVGGAEMALVRLLEGLDRRRFASVIVNMRSGGILQRRAAAAGARVIELGMRRSLPSPKSAARLVRSVRALAPDIVQGWMYHGNLAAWFATRFLPRGPALTWNIRQSLASVDHEKPLTRRVIALGARLSRTADCIVTNSRVSVGQHVAVGFDGERFRVIPNGFDTAAFAPSEAARAALRDELALPRDALLVGIVGRYHAVKCHGLFLASLRRAVAMGTPVHAVLVGPGCDRENASLAMAVADSGMSGRAHLLGEREDVARIMPGLDLLVSASGWAEGFPNVVGEAMSSGVPCVVTDTGDCAAIVGGTGYVVPAEDESAIAGAVVAHLGLPPPERAELGSRARQRIVTKFGLDAMVSRYADLYASLAAAQYGRAA